MEVLIEKSKRQIEEVFVLDIIGNVLPQHHPITKAEG